MSSRAVGTAVSVARVRPGRKKGMGAVRRLIRFIKNLKELLLQFHY